MKLIADLPSAPAVYAMYGGRGTRKYVAYVGIAENLRSRIVQHLIKRDSSVTTGTAAVCVNPDYVTEICWWEHPSFADATHREAAELIAFERLDPALRSRGATRGASKLLNQDRAFRESMLALFGGPYTGSISFPHLEEAVARIEALEARVKALERAVASRDVPEGKEPSTGKGGDP